MPWGGTQLPRLYGMQECPTPVGEAWLLSDHPLHQSVATSETCRGSNFRQLIQQHRLELFGTSQLQSFPILIKILDAAENLSIQVHPDDAQALIWSPAERGKSEAWVVLSAVKDSTLYIGLKPDCNFQRFQESVRRGDVVSCLNRILPQPGEVYAIPPGTVHAIGAGIMLLEVQQSSDATFRLDDWGRKGADGKPRQLHLEAGLACTRQSPAGSGLQSIVREPSGAELLVTNSFFSIRQWSRQNQPAIEAPAIVIPWRNGVTCKESGTNYDPGNAILIPACMKQATFLMQPETMLYEIHWH